MNTVYGESPVIETEDSYIQSGRIRLNSASSGTVDNASSEDGAFFNSWKILWTVTYDATTDGYTGGITGAGWYFNDANSPFYGLQAEETEIFTQAYTTQSLYSYFNAWNQSKDGEVKLAFINTVGEPCRDIT